MKPVRKSRCLCRKSSPLYRPDGIYQVNELRNYFYQQAEELARRYDARNGNSGYMDRLKDLMSN